MKPLHFFLLLIFLPSSIRCIYSFSQAANSLVFSHTRNRVFPELKYFLVLLLLASCTVTPKDDGTTPAPLFPQAKSFQSNPPGGYAINLVSGDSIDPILNMQGDTLKTGVHIPALGKIIHPDSVSRPKSFPVTPKGLLIKKNVYSNRKIISVNLTVILIDTSKLTYIPVPELVEGDTSHFIINSMGTKLATGTSIPTRGKVVPAIQPESEVALLPQIKDAAITNLQYLDVEQGMPSSNILSIAEDRNGNFWFGTWEGGVSKYDGAGFTTYTEKEGLSSNTVWTIEEDRSGNLWFGTEGGGVSKYDGSGFTHYSEKEGLSSKTVLSIVEDHNGNLWFGSRGGGVSKFNGMGFTHFTEKEGLSSNRVLSIAEDRRGNLWFGTEGGGVSKFDGKGFTHYTEKDGLSSNQVWSIVEDRKGNLWFGTEGGGVSKFDGDRFTHLMEKDGLGSNTVRSIVEDRIGNLWFGSDGGGVSKYDGEGLINFSEKEGLSSNRVLSIVEDRIGKLWFGTDGGGVSKYDEKGFSLFTEKEGLSSNRVRSILEDRNGNLWFGTWGGGVIKYDGKELTQFTGKEGIRSNSVWSIIEDRNRNLWFGTGDGGVLKYDGERFTYYTEKEGLSSNTVWSILEDKNGNLWFGTDGGGVSKYDGEGFTHFTEKQGLSNNRVLSIVEDRNGNLWFGTWGGGVSKYDGKGFTHYTEKEGLSSNRVWSILEDRSGNLWIGTGGSGVSKFDGKEFTHYTEKEGLSSNIVRSIVENKQVPNGIEIYLGTEKGISKMIIPSKPNSNVEVSSIQVFEKQDGLKSLDALFSSAFIDSKNQAWWGMGKNLTMLDLNNQHQPVKDPPTVYLRQLAINEQFIDYHNLRDQLGSEIKFHGVKQFENYPLLLEVPYKKNHLTFLFSAIDWSALHKIRYSYRMLGLDDRWSIPSFEPKADFRNLPYGTFIFQLRAIGESGEWSKPFEYSFTIRPPWWQTWWAYLVYSILFGVAVWNVHLYQKGKVVQVERQKAQIKELEQAKQIEKAYLILKSTQDQLIQSERIANLAQQAEALRLKELDSVKTKLYTNITHEFRTPLTIILGVANQVLDNPSEHLKKGLKMIIRNGRNLLMLVNQMLDLSKLESGKLSLQYHNSDVISFLGYIVDSFYSFAESKGIQIHFISVKEQLNMDFDEVRFQQIVSNIISNALKFTPDGGHVYVSTDTKNDSFILKIKDTGIGINEMDLPHIFDRFFQADDSHTRHGEGTGIGLALTYKLVKLMKGTIAVKSKEGHGSEFEVVLPIGNISDSKETANQVPSESMDLDTQYENAVPIDEVSQTSPIGKINNENGIAHVLISDDNEDVLAFVSSCFENEFVVEVAKNGQECEEKAFNSIPDLIVMDVMMPIKNGFEVCKTLKTDERTSHIPIILLTAKADLDSKLQGLERGADDYLTKPFHKKELLLRIKNLLDLRRQLQQYYRSSLEESLSVNSLQNPGGSTLNSGINGSKDSHPGNQNPSIPLASSLENAFVIKVRKEIESHLEEPDFDVEKLCRSLALSHSQVHRKLSALTGLSVTLFIRYMRLIKAKEMILTSGFSITAIAYDCGFNDPGYFGRIFKKEYGVSPQVWREQNST
jgi:signal transduction histidine kinase/ligand-binding sensor domain-containing protein/CheY-like chemotaxis protein/AraC-like DNA-binding protein